MLAFLTALALSAGGAPATAQPATAAEARMLIEKARQEIAEEEKAWADEVARDKEAEGRRRQRFAEFNQDKLRIQQGLAEQEQKIKGLLAKMESHQYKDRELKARFRSLAAAVAAEARELRALIPLGLPYQIDKRTEQLDLLVRDVDGGNVSPEEAFNRLWVFYQNQARMAQEAEVYTGDFAADAGDPIQVKYLRVGRQLLAFTSLDGGKLGIMRRGPEGKYDWVREGGMDYAARHALKEAIATAEGKSVPGFKTVPVWRAAFAPEEAGQ